MALEAELLDDAGGRRPGRDDHALAAVPPRGGDRGEREQVRGVVGADDEQGHRATSA